MHGGHDERRKKLSVLAAAEEHYPDELLADFQQYYGLDLWTLELKDGERDLARAAALAFQLPRESRVKRAVDPTGANSPELLMLRRIEFNQRSLFGRNEDGSEMQPVLLDGESEEMERLERVQRKNAEDVAAAFNLNI